MDSWSGLQDVVRHITPRMRASEKAQALLGGVHARLDLAEVSY